MERKEDKAVMDRLRVKALFIEDDEDDYTIVEGLLSEIAPLYFSLDWVTTYEEALDAAQRHYDVFLIDYRLGAHTGLDVLRELKQRGCMTPMILLTGRGDYKVDMEAMQAGAADYLVKGQLSAPLLERSIRYAVERGRAEEALRNARDELEMRVMERTAALAVANEELRVEIEERRRVEDALRKSSEDMKVFAYSVAHDLKSPIIGIFGLTKRLHERYGNLLDEQGMQYCEQIMKVAQHVALLVDKINVFAATREAPLEVQRISIPSIVNAVREEFAVQLRARQVELSAPSGIEEIVADKLSMLRLFRNLIENSLKYGGSELSRITIGFEESEGFYVLRVSDNGVGVSPERFERLFGLFQRDNSLEGVEGSGLGLAIVREIARRHRGRVWAEPGTERGITFCVAISRELPQSECSEEGRE